MACHIQYTVYHYPSLEVSVIKTETSVNVDGFRCFNRTTFSLMCLTLVVRKPGIKMKQTRENMVQLKQWNQSSLTDDPVLIIELFLTKEKGL